MASTRNTKTQVCACAVPSENTIPLLETVFELALRENLQVLLVITPHLVCAFKMSWNWIGFSLKTSFFSQFKQEHLMVPEGRYELVIMNVGIYEGYCDNERGEHFAVGVSTLFQNTTCLLKKSDSSEGVLSATFDFSSVGQENESPSSSLLGFATTKVETDKLEDFEGWRGFSGGKAGYMGDSHDYYMQLKATCGVRDRTTGILYSFGGNRLRRQYQQNDNVYEWTYNGERGECDSSVLYMKYDAHAYKPVHRWFWQYARDGSGLGVNMRLELDIDFRQQTVDDAPVGGAIITARGGSLEMWTTNQTTNCEYIDHLPYRRHFR